MAAPLRPGGGSARRSRPWRRRRCRGSARRAGGPGVGQEPAGEDALLLVAAREAGHRDIAAGRLDRAAARWTRRTARRSARGSISAGRRSAREAADRDVLGHGHAVEQAQRLAVLGHQGDPGPDRLVGVRNRTGRPSSRHATSRLRDGLAPKSASSSSVRPAPSRPGDAHDLAGRGPRTRCRRKARPAAFRRAGQRRGPRPRGPRPAGGRVLLGVELGDLAPDHPADDLVGSGRVARRGVPTNWPSRSTVTRSARVKTSFILCEM